MSGYENTGGRRGRVSAGACTEWFVGGWVGAVGATDPKHSTQNHVGYSAGACSASRSCSNALSSAIVTKASLVAVCCVAVGKVKRRKGRKRALRPLLSLSCRAARGQAGEDLRWRRVRAAASRL